MKTLNAGRKSVLLIALLAAAFTTVTGSAHASSLAPTAAAKTVTVKTLTAAEGGPVIKLGRAMLEEFAQTPHGPTYRELTPGGTQAVRATDDKQVTQTPTGKA